MHPACAGTASIKTIAYRLTEKRLGEFVHVKLPGFVAAMLRAHGNVHPIIFSGTNPSARTPFTTPMASASTFVLCTTKQRLRHGALTGPAIRLRWSFSTLAD